MAKKPEIIRVEKKYITLSEFAEICNKKESTIIKKYKDIPIIEKKKEIYRVLVGTRYPAHIKKYKINNDSDKRYVLLKCISQQLYVDHKMLGVYQNTFEKYLKNLIELGYIEENHNGNNYGANAYDCTEKGASLSKKQKKAIIKELTLDVAEVIGKFVGVIVSEVFTPFGGEAS